MKRAANSNLLRHDAAEDAYRASGVAAFRSSIVPRRPNGERVLQLLSPDHRLSISGRTRECPLCVHATMQNAPPGTRRRRGVFLAPRSGGMSRVSRAIASPSLHHSSFHIHRRVRARANRSWPIELLRPVAVIRVGPACTSGGTWDLCSELRGTKHKSRRR